MHEQTFFQIKKKERKRIKDFLVLFLSLLHSPMKVVTKKRRATFSYEKETHFYSYFKSKGFEKNQTLRVAMKISEREGEKFLFSEAYNIPSFPPLERNTSFFLGSMTGRTKKGAVLTFLRGTAFHLLRKIPLEKIRRFILSLEFSQALVGNEHFKLHINIFISLRFCKIGCFFENVSIFFNFKFLILSPQLDNFFWKQNRSITSTFNKLQFIQLESFLIL